MSKVRQLQPDPEEGTLPKSQIYFTYLSVALKSDLLTAGWDGEEQLEDSCRSPQTAVMCRRVKKQTKQTLANQ